MSTEEAIDAAEALAKALDAILQGHTLEAVVHALDAVYAIVPDGELAPFLTAASIRRAKALKTAADRAKFGSTS